MTCECSNHEYHCWLPSQKKICMYIIYREITSELCIDSSHTKKTSTLPSLLFLWTPYLKHSMALHMKSIVAPGAMQGSFLYHHMRILPYTPLPCDHRNTITVHL